MNDNNDFERRLKEALMKGTDKSITQKQRVWKNIEERIQYENKITKEDRGVANMNRSRKAGMKRVAGVAATALIVVTTLFAFTQPGQAAVGKIRELFAPQKKIVEHIEGMPEKNEFSLHESKMDYVIYIDEERYTIENQNGTDKIVPKIKAENRPAVFMEISQVTDKDPKTLEEEIEGQLKKDFEFSVNEGLVDEPLKGIHLRARNGDDGNATVVQYYLVDNTKGGTFIIKQQYFLEAAEGHGARFYYMLQEFKLVNE